MSKKTILQRVRWTAYTAACLGWFLMLSLPAWALYAVSLGAVRLEFFVCGSPNWIEITIPGWSRNTFTYGVPAWRPF